jgi:hypothetical protein
MVFLGLPGQQQPQQRQRQLHQQQEQERPLQQQRLQQRQQRQQEELLRVLREVYLQTLFFELLPLERLKIPDLVVVQHLP